MHMILYPPPPPSKLLVMLINDYLFQAFEVEEIFIKLLVVTSSVFCGCFNLHN